MNKSDEITIQIADLEDARHLLAACLNYHQAADLMRAQTNYEAVSYSPLTQELGRVATRFSGYMSDHLLARYEAEGDDADEDTDQEPLEPQEGAEEAAEASEELPNLPLGAPKIGRQQGRRVPASRKAKLAETQGEEVAHTDG